jgi:hypothetical protein
MVRLLLVRAVSATPSEVAKAYRESIESRPAAEDRAARSEVKVQDGGRIRFVSEGRARIGAVRIDGFVTWEGDRAWTCRREISVDGQPYSWEIEKYHLEPRNGGCDLTLDSEVHARGPLQETLLLFGKRRLMVQRYRELDRWLPPADPGRSS